MSAGRLPQLHLVTTSVAHPDSAAAVLGPDDHDAETALTRLEAAARTSDSKETVRARERFLALDRGQALRILANATVLDSTVRVVGLAGRLRTALGLVVPSERPDDFLERVQGWWVGRSTQLLAREISHVSGADLYRFCDALRDEFRRGQLTVSEELFADPDEAQAAALEDAVFVRQLRLVMASSEELDLAVRHYFRAYAQRSRWVRDLEDVDGDLVAYERRLCDEWEIAHIQLRSRLGDGDGERQRGGLELAQRLATSVSARLRGLDEPVLCRGTLHGLADDLRIGWHPDFRARVTELLADQANAL